MAALTSNGVGTCGADDNQAQAQHLIVQPMALRGRETGAELEISEPGGPMHAMRSEKRDWVPITAPTLQSAHRGVPSVEEADGQLVVSGHPVVSVRRLTPLECERLQGYPDGWTDNGQADSARYRQLGNSVAVPCVEWIARRLVVKNREI